MLKRSVPSGKETVFGLENETYYFYSPDYHEQFFIGLETFDLESYGPAFYLSKTIGFTSSKKQLTLWQLSEFPSDVQDYIVDNLVLY